MIRNIVVLHSGEVVTTEMLPPPLNQDIGANIADTVHSVSNHSLEQNTYSLADRSNESVHNNKIEPLWIVEKRAIQKAIDACDGNIPRAAGLLEVSPSTIYRKLQAWQDAASK